MQHRTPFIAVVGSYGVGMTMRVPRVPAVGETLAAGPFDLGPGGKGSNQAIAASRLGATVSLLTCVGDDEFGRQALALWSAEGVDASSVKTGRGATMVGFILVEPSGENRITIARGALEELSPADVRSFAPRIAGADLCIVGLEIPMAAALAALEIAEQAGTRVLLNPAPASPLPGEAWPRVGVLTPNRQEAAVLLGLAEGPQPSIDELVRGLRRLYDGDLVVTLGAEGAALSCAGQPTYEVALAVRPARVVDTTGAGDAFNAALAVALIEGRDLHDAVTFANAAGSRAVETAGVLDGLPRRRDLSAAADGCGGDDGPRV